MTEALALLRKPCKAHQPKPQDLGTILDELRGTNRGSPAPYPPRHFVEASSCVRASPRFIGPSIANLTPGARKLIEFSVGTIWATEP
jgi:hypothetical protein